MDLFTPGNQLSVGIQFILLFVALLATVEVDFNGSRPNPQGFFLPRQIVSLFIADCFFSNNKAPESYKISI